MKRRVKRSSFLEDSERESAVDPSYLTAESEVEDEAENDSGDASSDGDE